MPICWSIRLSLTLFHISLDHINPSGIPIVVVVVWMSCCDVRRIGDGLKMDTPCMQPKLVGRALKLNEELIEGRCHARDEIGHLGPHLQGADIRSYIVGRD